MTMLPAGGFGRAAIGGLALGASAGVGAPVLAEAAGGTGVAEAVSVGTAVKGLYDMRHMAGPMDAARTGVATRGIGMALGATVVYGTLKFGD